MEYHKVSSATISKKLTDSRSFSGKNIYDGVFGGPVKVAAAASRVVEDYGEIFGGSATSSIPILNVPELNERKVPVDVNTSKLDYSKIFGGFGDFDFGVSHDQLFVPKPKRRDTCAEEARSPAETGSYEYPSSVEHQVSSSLDASYQSFDGAKEFKMSYHKTNQGRKNGTNHVAHLHAVPGYTRLIDEVAPSQMSKGEEPLLSVVNDTCRNVNFSGELMEGKCSKKAVSTPPPPDNVSKQASGDGTKFQNKSNQSRSNSSEILFDAFDIGLKSHASKVPSPVSRPHNLSSSKSDSGRSMGSKFGVSKTCSFEDADGFCSPPYFDEEIDTNSVAAASAAAVKKAIEEAQARIKIAKEIMERKKEGLQNHAKLRFNDALKAEDRREFKVSGKADKFREEVWERRGVFDAQNQVFARLGTKNAMTANQMAPDFGELDKLIVTKEASGVRHENRREGEVSDKANKPRDEALQKCEEIGASKRVIVQPGTQSQVAPDFREMDKQFFAKEASGGRHGNENKLTPTDHRPEEMKDWEAGRWGDSGMKMVPSVNECKEKSSDKKIFEKPEENGEKLKSIGEANKQEEVEKKFNALEEACELKECANEPKLGQEVHDQEEYRKKRRVAELQEENEATFKASHEVETNEEKLRRVQERTANGKMLEMQELNDNECMKTRILKDEQECLENEMKQREVLNQEENNTRSEDVPEREENEAGVKEIFDHKEHGKRDETASERIGIEEPQNEACWVEENEGREDVHSREVAEKTSDEVHDQRKFDVRSSDFHDGEQSEKELEEINLLGEKEKLVEAEDNEKILEEAYQMNETERTEEESSEWMDAENLPTEIDQIAEDEKIKITEETLKQCRNNLEAADRVSKQEKIEILSETLEASRHGENNECLEVPTHEENEGILEATQTYFECTEIGTESSTVEVVDDLEEEEVFEVKNAALAQIAIELDDMKKQVKDTTEDLALEYNEVNSGITDMDVQEKQHGQHAKESEMDCSVGMHVEESEENFKDVEEVEVAMKQEEYESNSESSHEERWVDSEENMEEPTQLPSVFQVEEETEEIPQTIQTSQNTEKDEENRSQTLTTERMEAECSMQKEVELEKEHSRKIDEAKERKREKDKERKAVERVIREARERAFTEARERAERAAVEKANAEARRRATAGTRQRMEKASAEGNDKSSADKPSMEARLKAERAAVERATAEARERALEKAMSEKATQEARSQAVRSSGASRDNGMRQNFPSNDTLHKGSGTNQSSGYPNSSNHGDKLDGDNGDSAQRHKAKSERHQRTSERAAKALAEKNMRDLLAQKEQAERDRLAEALDADVKRWSKGKEGNLRALLSTLQYILGPASGWQPIPLTELIATTAVKKAYRKATLVVHPDKLQQRGASIQQKYTCEKVFDLLKEAWNKFSGEER